MAVDSMGRNPFNRQMPIMQMLSAKTREQDLIPFTKIR